MKKTYNRISNDEPTSSYSPEDSTIINNNNAGAGTAAGTAAASPSSPSSSSSSSPSNYKSLVSKISEKIHALFIIILSYFTVKQTDTIPIILTSNDIVRPLLYIAIILLSINTVLMLYLSIYIPKIKGINIDSINIANYKRNLQLNNNNTEAAAALTTNVTNSDLWAVYCPRVIPIMTLNGVLCGVFLIRCFWPIWGFLTPFIVAMEFFGLLFLTQFIPWC